MFKNITLFVLFPLFGFLPALWGNGNYHLPTPNPSPQIESAYLQPTEPGKNNGGFGMVRENGTRYHGGVDIRPTQFDFAEEPSDPIFSICAGRVVYINHDGNRSSYGKYVVIEHSALDLGVFSLYAHLSHIDEHLKVGAQVTSGQALGTMGRSSNCYEIPKKHAHLHFEMGLRIGSPKCFQQWYDQQKFDGPNAHGEWNGLNFVTFDPLPLLKKTSILDNLTDYVQSLPTAFVTRIYTHRFPEFLDRYGALLGTFPTGKIVEGYDVEWTWNGIPKRWTPHFSKNKHSIGGVQLLHWNRASATNAIKRGCLFMDERGEIRIGKRVQDTLVKIFDDL